MSHYTPDNWVILKINGKDPHYKVLAVWSGGYLSGDSWRLNSGITRHELDGDYWNFYGYSGSFYRCHVDSFRRTHLTVSVYQQLIDKYGEDMVEYVEDNVWTKDGWNWIISEDCAKGGA